MSKSENQKNGFFNRRDFLKTGALSGLALGSGALLKGCSNQNGAPNLSYKSLILNVAN